MQKDSELFSQAVKTMHLGNRLADDAALRSNPLFQEHKALTDRNIAAFRRAGDPTGKSAKLPPVLVDYIDSPLAGAFAFKYNDIYIISINYVIILILEFMFNRLLSSREFLAQIGNPQAELGNLPIIPITTNYNDIIAGIQTYGLSPFDFIPRDEERQGVARFLTFTAIRFMIGHEFRHVHAGHTDYYANGFKLGYISEYVSKGGPVEISMKQQAMEWDCDRWSLFCELASCWRTRGKALRNPVYADFYRDVKLLFFLCMTACSGFFRLLDGDTPPRSDWNTFSHPPSRNRRHILVSTGLMWGELRFPQDFYERARLEIALDCAHIIEIYLSY